MSDNPEKVKPAPISNRKKGLIMGMGFAGLLLVFALIALQELR